MFFQDEDSDNGNSICGFYCSAVQKKTSFPLEEDVIMFISEPSPFHYKNYVVTT